MSNESIRVEYNRDLKSLEELLSGVKRAGDFFVNGVLEIPMPKVEVEGVGVLSFPVPPTQVAALIQQATRAPYGRGEETILDESVRKVWQLPPGGKKLVEGNTLRVRAMRAGNYKFTDTTGAERTVAKFDYGIPIKPDKKSPYDR